MPDRLIQISDATFDDTVLASKLPVLVDFWAPWCGPCKAMAPILVEVATERDGQWLVGSINIQDSPMTAGRFAVRSIPTLMFFKNGQCKGTLIGTQKKDVILEKMTELAT